MSTATPSDVNGVIETTLSDSDIQVFLDDAAYEADQAIDSYSSRDATDKRQLEKYLAALKIAQTKDPAVSETDIGDAALSYDGSTVEELRKAVAKRDPSGTLADGPSPQANFEAF